MAKKLASLANVVDKLTTANKAYELKIQDLETALADNRATALQLKRLAATVATNHTFVCAKAAVPKLWNDRLKLQVEQLSDKISDFSRTFGIAHWTDVTNATTTNLPDTTIADPSGPADVVITAPTAPAPGPAYSSDLQAVEEG